MLERLQTESREVNHQAHQSPQLDRFAAYKTVGSKLEDEDARSSSSGVTAAKISEGGGARGESGRLLTPKDFPFVGSKRASDSGSRAGASPPRSSQVVGWPPFGSHRMNSLVNNQATTKSAREEGEEAGKKKDDETKGILVTQVLRNNQKLD